MKVTDVVYKYIDQLIQDRTTNKNIIFATDSYQSEGFEATDYFSVDDIKKLIASGTLNYRVCKSKAQQKDRTKKKAEVFTPTSICKDMINMCEPPTDWKELVNSTWLEITCGEAPYLVSRYDATTGEAIAIPDRVGILDRKLRAVNANANDKEWFDWIKKAYKTTYGYEWQGDNLFIARINLLQTFFDFYEDKQHQQPSATEIDEIVNIIVWNLFQMDGLKDVIPLTEIPAKLYDWEENHPLFFYEMKCPSHPLALKATTNEGIELLKQSHFSEAIEKLQSVIDLLDRGKAKLKKEFSLVIDELKIDDKQKNELKKSLKTTKKKEK